MDYTLVVCKRVLGREGGREGGEGRRRERQQIPPAVDFPQVQLVIIIIDQGVSCWNHAVNYNNLSVTTGHSVVPYSMHADTV